MISTTMPGTVPLQILANIKNYLLASSTDKKASDNERKLRSFVKSICIGGNSIDWSITDSVKTVCEVLGVCKSSVYEYRKVTELVYVPPKRKRRTNALAPAMVGSCKCSFGNFLGSELR